MNAVEVWLVGGPVDGRLMLVETSLDGALPATVVLPQVGLFLGSGDTPNPRLDHTYRRGDDINGQPVYEYESTRPASPFL